MDQFAWSDEDEAALKEAVELMEHETLPDALLGIVGSLVGGGIKSVSGFVPARVQKALNGKLASVLERSFDKVLLTVDRNAVGLTSAGWFARISVAVSGGVGGAFGLPGTLVELPVTTALLMRGIAQVAVREGEDLSTPEAKLECLKVFAFGGSKRSDDEEDEGYYATRLALAAAVPQLAEKTVAELLPKLVVQIAEHFAPAVTSKIGSQSVPGLGAASGLLVNSAFADHFERKAKGHFVVRRLERRYGEEAVLSRYETLQTARLAERAAKLGPAAAGA